MGVVHHSHYPVYFEQGRTEYFREYLIPYQEFEEKGLMAPVISYTVTLKGRLCYGDILTLETFALNFRGLRVVMGYRGLNKGKVVVEGESTHALTDLSLKALHPRHLPESYQYLKKRFHELLSSGKAPC
jgi:acyl-CoA thioester hydrolase